MNRATLRSILSRRVGDTDDRTWTEAEKNEALDHGAFMLSNKLQETDPEFLVRVAYADVVNGQVRYEKPGDMWGEIAVGYRDSVSPTGYRDLDLKPFSVVRKRRQYGTSSGVPDAYATRGRYIELSLTPQASVNEGLEIVYTSSLAMGTDNDVPECHPSLHPAIIYEAQLLLEPDAKEASSTLTLLERLYATIPSFYRKRNTKPDAFEVEKPGPPARYRHSRRPNDMDGRG